MLEDINNKRSSYIIDTIFLNKEKMRIKEEKQIIKRNKNTNEYLLEFFKYMENEGDPEITKQYLETHSFH